jgi:hypothetical protein
MLQVALAFQAAWNCTAGNPPPFDLLDLNAYGCYCGGGSTGLDTEPVDAYDACCRQHDIDWTALCRNVPDPTRPGRGCDCYVNVPTPTGCQNNVPTFAAGLNACQQACSRELTKQFTCYANAFGQLLEGPDWTQYGNWCEWEHYPNPVQVPINRVIKVGPERPFDEILPSYCRKSADPLPPSVFGNYEPGANVFKPGTSCELAKADCTGSVTGCARSEDACRDMGGVPGGACTANVDVTKRPACPYRDPNNLCDCPPPPLPDTPPLCDVAWASEGDACNPCTGRFGSGGTCQQGVDLLVCVPGPAPSPMPSPSPSPTASPSPVPSQSPSPMPSASPTPSPSPSSSVR